MRIQNRTGTLDTPCENRDNEMVKKGVVRMKRFVCGILCLCMLWTGIAAAAEDEESIDSTEGLENIDDLELSAAELQEIEELDQEAPVERVTGKVYAEPSAEDFNANSPAIYTCKIRDSNPNIYRTRDKDQKKASVLVHRNGGISDVDVLYVGLQWMIVRKDNKIGYVLRQWVDKQSIQPVDPVNTPPFNEQKHNFTAVTATYCHVRKNMSFNQGAEDDGNNYVILNPGTKITIWQFYEGWAVVNYMREYGYIDPNELTELRPVSPTDEELYEDCPIAAYTSYYKMVQSKSNISRIHNIKVGCELVSRVIEPGGIFDGNEVMGPYGKARGYEPAIVLVNGKDVLGYGGGTCQVSSTLYNAVLQLPGLKILKRHAHGGNGATYLPIHCDAAVGTANLNFRFMNMYDFPIRIEACTSSDGALSMRIYKAH